METPVLIIGAGPAGLAAAAQLRSKNIPFEVVEQSDKIAIAWHNHYDRLCLHTVKQFSNLPLMDFPEDYPLYVPRKTLVEYFERYAEHFNIKPHFKQEVKKISPKGEKWQVKTKTGMDILADQVIIAAGVNRIPYQPVWKGQDSFKGEIVHSRNYKNPSPFQGKRTLVIGFGNTGAEVALDLSEQGVDTRVVIRSPVSVVPRDLNGRPVQVTAKKLAKLPFGLGDWLGSQIRKIYFGNLTKYGIPQSKVHPAIQLRETGKTPVIDLGTIDHIKKGKIKVVGDIDHFYEDGVVLKTGENMEIEAVILATGYRARLQDFIPGIESFLDEHQLPKQAKGTDQFEGLFFMGYDNYKLGGILGTIQTESVAIGQEIAQSFTSSKSAVS